MVKLANLKIQDRKNLFTNVMAIVSFFVLAVVSLILVARIPIGEAEQEKVLRAYEERVAGYEVYPRITIENKLYLTTLDFWSECITIGQAFGKGSIPFVDRPSGKIIHDNICDDVKGSMSSNLKTLDKYYAYPQYIHGDAAVVKIILKLAELQTGKIVISLVILILMSSMIITLSRISRFVASIFFVYFFMLTDLIYQGFSLAHGIATSWALLIILGILFNVSRENKFFYALSFIGGSGYAIFSMMHNPIQFMGLLTMVSLLGFLRSGLNLESSLKKSFYLTLVWALGGLSTMIVHWIIVGQTSYSDSLKSALSWGLSGRLHLNIFDSIYIFFGLLRVQIFQFSLTMFGLLVIFFILGYIVGFPKKVNNIRYSYYFYLLNPTLNVLIWFILMTGHIGHGWTINLIFTSLINIVISIYLLKDAFDLQSPTRKVTY
jgi:hypothetical protein